MATQPPLSVTKERRASASVSAFLLVGALHHHLPAQRKPEEWSQFRILCHPVQTHSAYPDLRSPSTMEYYSQRAQSKLIIINNIIIIMVTQYHLGCRQDTHSQDTSVQCSLITAPTAHSMRLSSRPSVSCKHLCVQNKCCHLVCHMSHPWLFSHAPSSMSTSSSSPTFLPHNENTQYTPHVSKITQSTSCAIKNHSDVNTCRVAETRAQQLPQVMSQKNLRLSRGSKLILEIHINFVMYRKNLRRRSPSSDHRRSGGIWKN